MERQAQEELLRTFLDPIAFPPAFSCHGPTNSGKSCTLAKFASTSSSQVVAWVNVQQSITPRLVLQKALELFAEQIEVDFEASCENAMQFFHLLSHMIAAKPEYSTKRLVLVLDRIDTLDGNQALYIPFSRLSEHAPYLDLCVVFVYQSEEPKFFISSPIPHVYFPRYTTDEAISILQRDPLPEFLPEVFGKGSGEAKDEARANGSSTNNNRVRVFYNEFVRITVQALSPYTDTNIERLRKLIAKLWVHFVNGECSPNFAIQYTRRAHIFQSEGFVLDSLPPAHTFDFPEAARYLLCAAFLASHNAERYDYRFFSRSKEVRAKRRRTAPRKEAVVPERAKPGKVFELERLLAIFHALLPDAETFVATTRTYSYLADLTSQNFITRSSPQMLFEDPLYSRTRWCANISFQFAKDLAESLGLNIEDYMVGEFTEG